MSLAENRRGIQSPKSLPPLFPPISSKTTETSNFENVRKRLERSSNRKSIARSLTFSLHLASHSPDFLLRAISAQARTHSLGNSFCRMRGIRKMPSFFPFDNLAIPVRKDSASPE